MSRIYSKSIIIYSEHQRDSLIDKLVSENIPYSIHEKDDPFEQKTAYVLKVKSKYMNKVFLD